MAAVTVLDTTLRDGNYAIAFRFTGAHTAAICGALETAGFRYIEVGHGLGLRASSSGYGRAAATDEEYLCAARQALHHAAFGMFCIPGIAEVDDIEMAADHGMSFIRIGTDVTKVAESRPYIQRARARGMCVMANLMKSYAVSPIEFARAAHASESYGAEVVYLVDSAGCMFPEQVTAYVEALRERSDVALGFHGHDNLRLAIANTLNAIDRGARFVDSSLQGLGRSAGNAVTEVLVAALERRGCATGIDLLHTLHIGDSLIRPLLSAQGIGCLDVVAGYAGFHSGFQEQVVNVAERYQIDPARLIIELCQVTQLDARDDVLQRIAGRIQSADICAQAAVASIPAPEF